MNIDLSQSLESEIAVLGKDNGGLHLPLSLGGENGVKGVRGGKKGIKRG